MEGQAIDYSLLFKMIQKSAGTDWREMYQVFNMGQRLEIFTDRTTAEAILNLSFKYKIDACISGFVENADFKEVVVESSFGSFNYR